MTAPRRHPSRLPGQPAEQLRAAGARGRLGLVCAGRVGRMTRSRTLTNGVILLVFVVFCVGVLEFLALNIGQGNPVSSNYTVHAVFANADGLPTAADVRVSGVDVGRVIDVTHDAANPGETVATLQITDSKAVPVYSNGYATVRAKTLLGEKYVDLTIGNSNTGDAHRGRWRPAAGADREGRLQRRDLQRLRRADQGPAAAGPPGARPGHLPAKRRHPGHPAAAHHGDQRPPAGRPGLREGPAPGGQHLRAAQHHHADARRRARAAGQPPAEREHGDRSDRAAEPGTDRHPLPGRRLLQ